MKYNFEIMEDIKTLMPLSERLSSSRKVLRVCRPPQSTWNQTPRLPPWYRLAEVNLTNHLTFKDSVTEKISATAADGKNYLQIYKHKPAIKRKALGTINN